MIPRSAKQRHLENAPAAEAIIELRAAATLPEGESELKEVFSVGYPDYPEIRLHSDFQFNVAVGDRNGPLKIPALEELGVNVQGVRMAHQQLPQIIICLRDRFSYSRLAPYQDWDSFQAEAMRCWGIYSRIGKPSNVERIGVRFINRIPMPSSDLADQYFQDLANAPVALRRKSFFYRDILDGPGGTPYTVALVRTVQSKGDDTSILLDVDVLHQEPLAPNPSKIRRHLEAMREIKNLVFFESLTEKALETCQ